MADARFDQLAHLLANHSMCLKAGEHVLIETFDVPSEMAIAMIRAARKLGAHPHVAERSTRVMAALQAESADDGLATWSASDLFRMEKMQAYCGIRGSNNVSESSGAPPERTRAYAKMYGTPVHSERRVNHTKWVVLRWPSPSMAQLAGKSTEAFEDFYFRVCLVDYAKMARACEPLAARMRAADVVRIKGPSDTDLTFSIKNIGAVPCCGNMNIPDGECFSAPVRDSVEGVLHYNTPTVYEGQTFDNVRFVFKKGKVVEATCVGDAARLNQILDRDEGSRYIGEFAIGFNPHITHAMKDILFDEKIAGSFHFTPGR